MTVSALAWRRVECHRADRSLATGTMVRLLKTLAQSGTIRWPALGSEVILEVWQAKDAHHYVRIMAYGQELVTLASGLLQEDQTSPGVADWTRLGRVVDYLMSRVPDDLVERCSA